MNSYVEYIYGHGVLRIEREDSEKPWECSLDDTPISWDHAQYVLSEYDGSASYD